MCASTKFTIDEIIYLNPKIVAEALTLLRELIFWVDNDVFTDAPERAKSVAGAEATLQLARQMIKNIDQVIGASPIVSTLSR